MCKTCRLALGVLAAAAVGRAAEDAGAGSEAGKADEAVVLALLVALAVAVALDEDGVGGELVGGRGAEGHWRCVSQSLQCLECLFLGCWAMWQVGSWTRGEIVLTAGKAGEEGGGHVDDGELHLGWLIENVRRRRSWLIGFLMIKGVLRQRVV